MFLLTCWGIFFLDEVYHLQVSEWGISPRTVKGLKGILFSPLIHGNLDHILSNSLPVLILGSLIFYFYKPIAWASIIWMWLISGLWLWVGGRNNEDGTMYHIGASSLIYAFASFIFFSGVFRKRKQLMVISALVILLYGSITWAIFPFDLSISWEGHLSGLLAGLLVAYNYRKEGPQAQPFVWEEEDDDDDTPIDSTDDTSPEQEQSPPALDPFTITYTFVPKPPEKKDEL
ncbi:MAG: rhomboid family intramembrane serine protease [Bacteroidetes bacterium]|nr:rhomboid family intramembrane serine protease [Bacteroidota bacterium]